MPCTILRLQYAVKDETEQRPCRDVDFQVAFIWRWESESSFLNNARQRELILYNARAFPSAMIVGAGTLARAFC